MIHLSLAMQVFSSFVRFVYFDSAFTDLISWELKGFCISLTLCWCDSHYHAHTATEYSSKMGV